MHSLPADVPLKGQVALAPCRAIPRVTAPRLTPPCAPALPMLRQKFSSVGFSKVHNALSLSPASRKSFYPVEFVLHTDTGRGSHSHIPVIACSVTSSHLWEVRKVSEPWLNIFFFYFCAKSSGNSSCLLELRIQPPSLFSVWHCHQL